MTEQVANDESKGPQGFKAGDRVQVIDPALDQLRDIMRRATGEEPSPNHHGTVDRVEDDEILINFDDGGCAPYPRKDVRPL